MLARNHGDGYRTVPAAPRAEVKRKTDKVDARILAQLLAADFLPVGVAAGAEWLRAVRRGSRRPPHVPAALLGPRTLSRVDRAGSLSSTKMLWVALSPVLCPACS
jgi:hypothetical protein